MDEQINPYNAGPAQISSPLAPGSAMASPMAVEFDFSVDDVAAWSWNKANASRGMLKQFRQMRLLLLTLSGIAAALVCLVRNPLNDLTYLIILVAAVALGLGFSLTFPFWFRASMKSNTKMLYESDADRLVNCRRRVAISPTGLVQTGQFFETRFEWTAIHRIDADHDHIFFDAGLGGEIILPRSAFTHEAASQAFIDTARRYLEQAAARPGPM